MLRTKEELNKMLLNKCSVLAFDNEKTKIVCDSLKEKHGVSIGTSMDMIIRAKIEEQNEITLFWLMESIDKVYNSKHLLEYYTEYERRIYPKKKIEKAKSINTLSIDCFQISNDQWITVKDVDFFMELRKSSKIRYNENAQRVLKRVIKNGKEIFKLAINRSAVKAIRYLMENNLYIPNTITLNISPEFDTDIVFKNNVLTIMNLDMFDISDGYHRYLAMCECKDSNPDFNFNMELRITNFPDEKACQFIWQEDQKTKMRKVDSESMNTNSYANTIVDFLIVNKTFYLSGNDNINKNGGKINYGELSSVIKYYYQNAKGLNKKEISDLSKEIALKLNLLFDTYPDILTFNHICFKDLCIMFYIINNYPESKYNIIFKKAINNSEKLDKKRFASIIMNKATDNDIAKYMKEVK